MPMKLCDITRFERKNDISINIYGWEKGREDEDGEYNPGFAYPLHITKEKNNNRHVNLLMVSNGETNHFCWIKNFSRLIGAQYTKNTHEHAYCSYCLHGFKGKAVEGERTRLEDAKRRCAEHEKECFVHGGQKTSFPDNPVVKFEAVGKQVIHFYIILIFSLNEDLKFINNIPIENFLQ